MSTEGDCTNMEEVEIKKWKETMNKKSLKERTTSMANSLTIEAGIVSNITNHSSKLGWMATLALTFQSLGVVYGDIGTSPLYVLASTFPKGIDHTDDILGVLSLIYYTILALPLLKYVFIVLKANDNGNGGAFALYSLLCRHANVSLIPNQQPEDMELSNYKLETPSSNQQLKKKLENSHFARVLLLFMTILGTTMVIGDGVFTPPMSVISAVNGISSKLGQDYVVSITIAILVILFCAQRFGTSKVGFSFAPILTIWFILIGATGIYNVFKYDVRVLLAINPKYIVDYFQRNGKNAWMSLGGVFLCISGCEAMFADLGHFNVRAIQMSFSFITLPAILAAYSGQAAYLRKFPHTVSNIFYECIPGPLYWPTFVVAVVASIIASQAIVSAAFSIISQALSMGCFPRVKVVHTSTKHQGQVYIPEINYMLMVACIVVTALFRSSEKLSNAYGVAIVCDMVITTFLVSVVMLIVWKKSIWKVSLFCIPFGCIELVYLSAQMVKFKEGGFLPLVSAVIFTVVMAIWFYAQKERYMFELKNKVSSEYLLKLVNDLNTNRMPGIGVLYCELVQGIPPIFLHFIANIPTIHSVVVFVSIKAIPITSVALEEKFLFQHVEPREWKIFRCIVRHGYNDVIGDSMEFESQLVQHLKEFITQESKYMFDLEKTTKCEEDGDDEEKSISLSCASLNSIQSLDMVEGIENEIKVIDKALEKGVVYMLGETEVVADPKSSFLNKIVVSAYNFLGRNFQQRDELMAIPRKKLIKVGMTYEI
ncbi:potassium transporter 5 [Medicago truncatula]|uniref:potassium transporter 5 n=1 Tax=Medicago truncatula TaxID=3880 RepID=UPI0019682EAB|nr:potassium transporter 5 [Medicago truncatula]